MAAALYLGACLPQSQTSQCSDAIRCPAGTVCADQHGLCVQPDRLQACSDKPDSELCSFGGADGICMGGLCFPARCGDGAVLPGEACDDGNNDSGDGCSWDCSSDESCGNGIVDDAEQCDCGADAVAPGCLAVNSDEPGSICRSDCIAHCGDGEVNSAEDCDSAPPSSSCVVAGFDAGRIACSDVCTTDFRRCERFGWNEVPMGAVNGLGGLWASPSGTIYATDGSHLRVFDGKTVSSVEMAVYGAEIWGRADHDIYVAGQGLLHYDGAMWSAVALPTEADGVGFDLIAGAGSRVYVASPFSSLIVEVDGEESRVIDQGACSSARDLAAVEGALWAACGVDLKRFDGSTWTTEASFGGIAAILAADGELAYVSSASQVWHRDDAGWAPMPALPVGNYVDLALTEGGRVAAVAYQGISNPARLAVFDGYRWSSVEAPDAIFTEAVATPGGGLALKGLVSVHLSGSHLLESLGAIGAQAIWSQGNYVAALSGKVRVFDGVSWDEHDLVAGTVSAATVLWGATIDELHCVRGGAVYARQSDASWSPIPAQPASGHAYGTSPQNIVVMDATGSAHHWNGASWSTIESGVVGVSAVWGQAGRYIAVGLAGAVAEYDGGQWVVVDLGTTAALTSVVGVAGRTYIGSADGRIWYSDGGAWNSMALPVTGQIRAITGTAVDHVYGVVGLGGTFHFDGVAWSPVRLPAWLGSTRAIPGSLYYSQQNFGGGSLYRLLELKP